MKPKERSSGPDLSSWFSAMVCGTFLAVSPLPTAAGDAAPKQTTSTPSDSFPSRDPKAQPNQIDLTKFYNFDLTEDWLAPAPRVPSNILPIPQGLGVFGGIQFDVRGGIQLRCIEAETRKLSFPARLNHIPIGMKVQRIHFLHGACWSQPTETQVASYLLHFDNGQELPIPVLYDLHVRNWLSGWDMSAPVALSNAKLAWTGENEFVSSSGRKLQIFLQSFENPFPNIGIKRIDVVSAQSLSGLFVLGITVDNAPDP